MVKTIINMTESKVGGEIYEKSLKYIFGDSIKVINYNLENNNQVLEEADLYIISGRTKYEDLGDKINESKVVIPKLTYNKQNFKMLDEIPLGSKVLLVNSNRYMAIEAASGLVRKFNQIEFIPYYPGNCEVHDCKWAITFGKPNLAPAEIENVIDLGPRIFQISTIMEIALRIDMINVLESKNFIEYRKCIALGEYSINNMSLRAFNIENKFKNLLEAMEEGVIGIDKEDVIFTFNNTCEKILNINSSKIVGKKINELNNLLPPGIIDYNQSGKIANSSSKLIRINNIDISVTSTPILKNSDYEGHFIIIQKFYEEEKKRQKLRHKLLNKGHVSRYKFDDIIGECSEMCKVKSMAEKMAKSDTTILIVGESGTGKELFAHSIHQASPRSDMPFVAINCAALSDTLLESELFGYVEGAFTGARKGGKSGLFELAHKGTIFLDELEAMSPNLQAKLLRVLQEREVMRIGGDEVIYIDVRVIGSTNEDINVMVKKGEFRKDLYYRLNTLQLDIPSLRDRGNDILLIMDSIKKQLNVDFNLTKDARDAFLNHDWDGNVRELKNIIEYLKYIDKKDIDISDLPYSMLEQTSSQSFLDEFYILCGHKYEKAIFLLKMMKNAQEKGIIVGRRQLSASATMQGYSITEQEIRTIITNLAKNNFLSLLENKRGYFLTSKGLSLCSQLHI
ncbi:sigma 54-interacting transcriptional regulator [Clostridioides sp. ES-S-0048-02]|uniref:sigma-54 interaction domain-containing protein n=1 Tax=Clostridioides sp. ES-S-0048-02 TaxID=2770777 RepID=UPI001D118E48|nr:sigma 54-interacting transcriptional regulator [Clostridioides sp. ES-S-0048-02]